MGGIVTKTNSLCNNFYANYYPKQSWLHPLYVTSFSTLALIGLPLTTNQAVRATSKLNFTYLLSLSGTFGVHLWYSLVSDPTLMNILPRQHYANLQSFLLPKYLCTITLFSGISGFVFLKRFPYSSWKGDVCLLGCLTFGSYALNLINSIWLAMQKLKCMNRMIEIEKSAGLGQQNTFSDNLRNALLDSDTEYYENKNKFDFLQSVVMLNNLASFIATGAQLYLMAYKGFFEI